MKQKLNEGEVLDKIRDLTLAARTIDGRLRMRDEIKRILESQGMWPNE